MSQRCSQEIYKQVYRSFTMHETVLKGTLSATVLRAPLLLSSHKNITQMTTKSETFKY